MSAKPLARLAPGNADSSQTPEKPPPTRRGSQDIGLPYMCDKRHPDDQLFIVAESDFRFYRRDCLGEDWLKGLAEEEGPKLALTDLPEPVPPATAAPLDGPDPETGELPPPPGGASRPSRSPSPERYFQGWRPTGRSKETSSHVSPELAGLVRCVTMAHRHGVGDLVWLSWNGRKMRKRHPSHGSFLLAVSAKAAKALNIIIFDGENY